MANKYFKFALAGLLILSAVSGTSVKAQGNSDDKLPQFLFSSFSKGLLVMKDGRKMYATLNYSMVDQEMVFEQTGQYLVVDKPEEIDTVVLQNRKFVYFNNTFLEVVSSGKDISIFIQQSAKYTPAAKNTAYGMTTHDTRPETVSVVRGAGNQFRNLDVPEDMVVTKNPVYLARINGEMNKFQNQNQFVKLFPGSETLIKDYIKKAKIDIKTPEGLASLGAFVNSLKK
jgi:hypothetical protein